MTVSKYLPADLYIAPGQDVLLHHLLSRRTLVDALN